MLFYTLITTVLEVENFRVKIQGNFSKEGEFSDLQKLLDANEISTWYHSNGS